MAGMTLFVGFLALLAGSMSFGSPNKLNTLLRGFVKTTKKSYLPKSLTLREDHLCDKQAVQTLLANSFRK